MDKLHFKNRLTIGDYRNRNQAEVGSAVFSEMGGGDYEEDLKEEEEEE